MVIAIRHGKTDWNAKDAGGEGQAEILRGNVDVPLNAQGVADVTESAQEIAAEFPVVEVRSTPAYQRAKQTRDIIAQVCGVPAKDAPEFAPYNPGDLSGRPVNAIIDIIEFLIDVPFIPAPGGDTFGDYFQRFSDSWHKVYAEFGGDDSRAVVLVLFGNEFRVLPAVTEGKPIDKYATQKVKPGEYVVIH
jgi:broad specificity phosphatase PhoE